VNRLPTCPTISRLIFGCDGDPAYAGSVHEYTFNPENQITNVADSGFNNLAAYTLNAEGREMRGHDTYSPVISCGDAEGCLNLCRIAGQMLPDGHAYWKAPRYKSLEAKELEHIVN